MRASALLAVLAGCGPDVPVDPGEQPVDGPYSTCQEASDCSDDSACEVAAGVGFCSRACAYPDASSCPDAPPNVPLDLVCVPRPDGADGFDGFCGLLCADEGGCPDGMTCTTERQRTMSGSEIVTEFCK